MENRAHTAERHPSFMNRQICQRAPRISSSIWSVVSLKQRANKTHRKVQQSKDRGEKKPQEIKRLRIVFFDLDCVYYLLCVGEVFGVPFTYRHCRSARYNFRL